MKSYNHDKTVATPLKGVSTKEWLDLRRQGIGGSESAGVLERSRWSSALEIYWDKIFETPDKVIESRFIESGNFHEPWIRTNYQFWDWDVKGDGGDHLFINKRNQNRLRLVRDPREMYHLKDMPFVKVNVDGIITGCDTYPGVGILECKTRKSQSVYGLPNGVSEADYLQLQHGMLVLGASYGVMGYLLDGCEWKFLPFMADPQLQAGLLQIYEQFWGKVQQARALKAKHKIKNYTGIDRDEVKPEILAQLKELEPKPTALSLDLIKNNYVEREEKVEIAGDVELQQLCNLFQENKSFIKVHEQAAKSQYAEILRHMDGAQVMQFDDGSTARVSTNKHGTVSLRVKMVDDG